MREKSVLLWFCLPEYAVFGWIELIYFIVAGMGLCFDLH